LAFGCGVFVDSVWWIVWVRRFVEGRFLGAVDFAGFWHLFLREDNGNGEIQGFFASLRMTSETTTATADPFWG
jgi:hypothetical protein